ncbi:UNVERIFIED_CONTAM: hypothetical protein HDU68_002517 [Siphonaria sp. JEL0065]|nr:hypothetical protein HDU68_002517 [Siphonaria sp. JEL0065]
MLKAEQLIAQLDSARDSLDVGLSAAVEAESVFYAPAQPAAKASARSHLNNTLTFLANARVSQASKCPLENREPIHDNPFYMFCLCHLHLGKLDLLENNVTSARVHFETAVKVFPYSSRALLALGNSIRVLAKDSGMLDVVEQFLEKAIKCAKELQENVDVEHEEFMARQAEGKDDEEEDDSEDEEEDWTQQESVTLEINAGLIDASNALILLRIQLDRAADAEPLLTEMNYKFRLASDVLAYKLPRKGPWRGDVPFVKAIDNALPPQALEYLQTAFHPMSVFWKQHFYCPDTPYFSYTHPLADIGDAPKSAIDQLILYVHGLASKLFPKVKQAKAAEWWTHCRTHNSGHQLHFDSAHEGKSDKKRKRVGPIHPIVSCVIYLSEGAGGPTMVTNQRLGDPLADRGWMVESVVNRLVVFDGSVLHGVIPGKGFHPDPDARRTSFMIAFWDHVDVKPSPENIPGSARPFPYTISSDVYTWPSLHTVKSPALWPGPVPESLEHVIPSPLDRVWQSVPDSEQPSSTSGKREQALETQEILEEHLELGYSKSELGLPNYNLVFQGF